jgi:hypothetical protein
MNKHLHINTSIKTSGSGGTVYALVLGTSTERFKGSNPFFRTNDVSVGVKIDEVGCNSICNRADEVAMDKKLLAVGLKNNQNTILRKYQDNFHRFNSASYYCNPSSILAFSNNFTSELFLQPLQIVHCKHSLVQR